MGYSRKKQIPRFLTILASISPLKLPCPLNIRLRRPPRWTFLLLPTIPEVAHIMAVGDGLCPLNTYSQHALVWFGCEGLWSIKHKVLNSSLYRYKKIIMRATAIIIFEYDLIK